MKCIAVVGGGISGLAAAFALEQQQQAGTPIEYALFEASPRLGGVLRTEHVDGCVVEAGPDSFLTEKPWAARLCEQVGIGDQLIGSNDSQRKTYILVKGKLVAMPDGLMFMVPTKFLPTAMSPLFSASTKLRMVGELFRRPGRFPKDESVAAFIGRHYGREMVERLADPLLTGVYGGEAAQLSVRAVLPRFAEMAATHGSLGRGMIASRRKMLHAAKNPPKLLFTSLKGGMQQMVDAVVKRLDSRVIRVSTTIQSIRPQEQSWQLVSETGAERFDGIILALPAHRAATLLAESAKNLADELTGITYSSSIIVALGYGHDVCAALPSGFGFLVPRSEGKRILAATFVHNKFPHRAPPEQALIRCFLGGSAGEEMLTLSNEEIVKVVRRELREILGIAGEPRFVRVYKWNRAMAQYGVGHLERLDRIEHWVKQLPGLALAGNGFRGIGIPDCVRSGQEAAAKVMTAVGIQRISQEAAAY